MFLFQTLPLKLFMKCCPKGSVVEKYNELLHIFDKEITFFQSMVPRIKEFAGNELDHLLPECFGAGEINGDLVMCLRDFSQDGFKVTGKEEFHSLEQINTALEQLAKFHAVTVAIRVVKGKMYIPSFSKYTYNVL